MNRDVIKELIQRNKDDEELVSAIQEALRSFEAYHSAIYTMEISRLYSGDTLGTKSYQEKITQMDQTRTACHNAVLANVSMLNRMAALSGLNPVYDGIISTEQPYRRQVGDAVLAFVQEIILERP